EIERAGDRLSLLNEREERAERARRDEVVPARVPNLGKRVVLREDRDVRTRAVADARAERRRHAAEASLSADANLLDSLGEPHCTAKVLEAEVGGGVKL